MSGVLRIALSYFWFLPMQFVMNLAGLTVVALGLLLFLHGGMDMDALHTGSIAAMIGCMIIALVPAYAGGVALRFASTRSQLHLRPHGRARMLLGTTLGITLLAALIVAPLELVQLTSPAISPVAAARPPLAGIGPLEMFGFAWSCIALLWCGMFFAAGSLLVFVVMVMTPAMFKFAPLLLAYSGGAATQFGATLAGWLIFCAWYANARSLPTPSVAGMLRSAGFESGGKSANSLLDLLASRTAEQVESFTGTRSGEATLVGARRQILFGIGSPLGRFVARSVPVLFLMLLWLVGRRMGSPDASWEIPTMWMLFGAMLTATQGYTIVRRSRFLWLRAGLTRTGLFNLAERSGLGAAAIPLLLITLGFLCVALANRPDRAAVVLVYVAEQWVFAIGVFYAGLCATRGWDAGGVLLTGGIGALLFTHAIVIQPHHDTSVSVIAGALVVLLPVAGLLRWYARHRWLVLDWRVARLLAQGQRTGV